MPSQLFNRKLESEDLPRIPKCHKKNRPPDSKWLQQKQFSFRPLLTFRKAVVLNVVIILILLLAGSWLYISVGKINEFEIDYTDCNAYNQSSTLENDLQSASSRVRAVTYNAASHVCIYPFELSTNFGGDVTFYYGLNNYYQNMRLYFRSRSEVQLLGKQLTNVESCAPYEYATDKSNKTLPIAPCGIVANSMFNDTFKLFFNPPNRGRIEVPWTAKDLINDKLYKKYQNPKVSKGDTLCDAFKGTAMPPAWSQPICKLFDGFKYGFESADFIMWMQTAALPHFRKLYRKLNRTGKSNFSDGLPAGSYSLEVQYNYPVNDFNGQKRFILSTTSIIGRRNYFLPVVYLSTAIVLFVATTLITFLHYTNYCGVFQKLIYQIVQKI